MSSARPVRRRQRLRRQTLAALFGLLAAFSLLTGLASTGAASSQPASSQAASSQATSTQEAGTGTRTASISITEVSDAEPGGTLTLRGTITNEGSSSITGSTVDVRQGVRLTTRDAIEEATSRTGFDSTLDGALVEGHSQDVGRIASGMSRTFSLEVPVSELSLGEDGVYQIGVTLTGQTEDEQWDQILGAGRTVVPWQPDGSSADSAQTQVTVLWPLISTTHLTAQTGSDEEQTPTFRDNSLLAEISPGGRLYELVTLGADLPVTWVIDPDLLASVDAMTEEYQVQTEDGLVAGEGQREARAWLGALEDAVQDSEVVALPFGDPDVASLAHRGKDVQGALSQYKNATELASVTVETVLGVEPNTDFSWPVEGAIDQSIVSVATSAGASNIIARSDTMRTSSSDSVTPTAARPIGGGVTAVVADAGLSTLFEGDMTSGKATEAQQQLLSQTMAITMEEPSNQRSIVISFQRMPSTDQVHAMARAVSALSDQADWVEFISLSEAAEAEPDSEANQQVPSASEYPERLRAQELPTTAFEDMRETQRTLEDFQVILTRPDRVTVPYGNAIRREMSTSWRGRAEEAEEYRTDLQDDLVGLTEQVHLIQKSTITLSGRSATIPVTVQNNLVQDVHNLELRLTSSRKLGLEVSGSQSVTVGGGHSESVKFSATANASGRTFLVAQLYTTDGEPYGEPMRFQANVTSITPAVMMVIAVGLLLVGLAGIRMYTQRKRAARHAALVAARGDDAPPGESGPDTRDGGSDPPPRGERLDPDD